MAGPMAGPVVIKQKSQQTTANVIEAALAAQRAFMDQWGDQLEQMLSAMVYLIPVQDESGDAAGFYSQAVYSVIDLFNLYRTVLLRSPEALPVALPKGGVPGAKGSPDSQLRHVRLVYTLAAFSLRVLRSIQVLIEMKVFRSHGLQPALRTCLRVEVVKLVLKLVMRSQQPFSFYVDEDALETVEPPKNQRASMLGLTDPNAGASAKPKEEIVPGANEAFVGKRSGKTLRALGGDTPGGNGYAPGCLLRDSTANSPQLMVAEALYHSRPLIHLLMLMRRGQKSWAALITASVLEKLSLSLLAPAVQHQHKNNTRAAKLELAELQRRRGLMWWAFARSPLFEKFLLRPAHALDAVLSRIPIINMFRIVELMLVLQPFYFTTSAS